MVKPGLGKLKPPKEAPPGILHEEDGAAVKAQGGEGQEASPKEEEDQEAEAGLPGPPGAMIRKGRRLFDRRPPDPGLRGGLWGIGYFLFSLKNFSAPGWRGMDMPSTAVASLMSAPFLWEAAMRSPLA